MFINQDIVAVVFRLINFVALIGVAFFLFKKHLMPDLLMSIATKKNDLDYLATQQTALEKQQLNLDALLKEDALMCESFRLKIDEWKKVALAKAELQEKEHKDTINKYNQRIADIALQREQTRVQNIVTHEVTAQLKESLSTHFNGSEKNAEYMNAIIQFMNEKTI